MILQSILFYIMFGHLFPDLPELKACVFSQYIEAEQNVVSGRNLLGALMSPTERARMDHVVRNQFLTILMYRHLLRRLIGDFDRNSSISKRKRRMITRIISRTINQMLTPLVSFVNLKLIHDSCKIFQRCAMRVIVHQIPTSVSWYNGGFQFSFTYPDSSHSFYRRIKQLAYPFSRLIDPTNEIGGSKMYSLFGHYTQKPYLILMIAKGLVYMKIRLDRLKILSIHSRMMKFWRFFPAMNFP